MLKRSMDLLISSVAIVLLLPVFLVVGILVWAKLGRPVIYQQVRPGLHGRPFTIYKFRTMLPETSSEETNQLSGSRMVPMGLALRDSSLDELPELFNILRGDMSLVGPRPLLMEYVPLYSPFERQRMQVQPGLTGWAQVNGRNAIDWETRFKLDVWYVNNQSLWLDIKILFKTLGAVVSRQGVNHGSGLTMPRFTGSGGQDEGKSRSEKLTDS